MAKFIKLTKGGICRNLKRRHLLDKLGSAEKRLRLHEQRYGKRVKGFERILKNIEKLLKYKIKYLKFVFSKIIKSMMVKAKLFWGQKFIICLPSIRGIEMYLFGILIDCEIKLTRFLIRNLDNNSIFYDVGAHYGFFSALAKELITNGEIHAFEPAPKNFRILKKNLFQKDNVFLNKKALFNKETNIDFYEAKDVMASGLDTLFVNVKDQLEAEFGIQSFKKITVETTTLDTYCKNHKTPTFLKIDAEGAEQHIIEGGANIFKDNNPVIVMEIWVNELDNESQLRAVDYLYALGYKSYKIKDNGDLEYIKKIDPDRDIVQFKVDNFVFKKYGR